MALLVTGVISGFAGFGMALLPALIGYAMDHAGITVLLWFIAGFAELYLAVLLAGT